MTKNKSNKLKPYINIGPGSIIKDELEARNWTQKTLSELTGITPEYINKILNDKDAITIEIAKKFSAVFETSPQFWMNLYISYTLTKEENKLSNNNIAIKSKIYEIMPISELKKKGWIKDYKGNIKELEKIFKKFWNIYDLDFENFEQILLPNFRKSNGYKKFNPYYAFTWYQMAKNLSDKFQAGSFDRIKLERLTSDIPDYTKDNNGIKSFIQELNNVGVKFFVLSHLQHTYLDGAAFLKKGNPVVVYTKRHDRIDNFWFTIVHEIAHILKHIKKDDVPLLDIIEKSDQNSDDITDIEKEADEFASRCLKKEEILKEFETRPPTIVNIKNSSEELNIGLPIIIGTLKYHEMLPWRNLNSYTPQASLFIPNKFLAGL